MRFHRMPCTLRWITMVSLILASARSDAVAQEPDQANENDAVLFHRLKDKEPVAFRDLAAYAEHLKRARDAKPADLAANARRDIGIRELWEDPEDFRSELVEVRGFVRGIASRESTLGASGKLYEVWVTPPDRESELFACVGEKLPDGFRVDASDGEPVVFYGFFLTVIAYDAGDSRRGAPLLIGRLERVVGENRAGPRTIPIAIVADDRGQIANAEVGEVQQASFEALRAELTSMLRDRELPFDRVSIRVDPRLIVSELNRTIELVTSLNVTSIDLRPLEGDER
jgi:hypothetical protein